MPSRDSPRALIAWTIVMVLVAAVAAWALYLARSMLLLIYVSILLAIGFSPLVRLIERQAFLSVGNRIPRWLAILVVYVTILGSLAAIGFVILPPFIAQARDFVTQFPALVERIQGYLIQRGIVTAHRSLGEIVQQTPGGSDVVGAVMLTFWGLIGGMLGLVSMLILTFYLLVDAESVFTGIVRLFPRHRRLRVHVVSRQITTKVSGWLLGQLILAAIIGATSALWLGFLGLPYFYVLALIAAVGEMIPIVGPILAALPGIVIAFTISWQLALGVSLAYLTQQMVEANILVPKLMERQVGLTPVAVMVALLLGGALLGIPGAILAVPTAAILQVVFQELTAESD
jgi:predicted PurR-regulated permease PerM